jgi:hypothetical protein
MGKQLELTLINGGRADNRFDQAMRRLRAALPADSREAIARKCNRKVEWVGRMLVRLRRDPERFGWTIGRAAMGYESAYYAIAVDPQVKAKDDPNGVLAQVGTVATLKELLAKSRHQVDAVELLLEKKQCDRRVARGLRAYVTIEKISRESRAKILEDLEEDLKEMVPE